MTNAAPAGSKDIRSLIDEHPQLFIWLGLAVIVLLAGAAYLPVFHNGFIWDDDYYVSQNRLLKSFEGLQRIWLDVIPHPADYPLPQYYPLTFTSFWLEYRAWGLEPLGYHAVNLMLHIGSALILWLLLKKLSVPGAWLAAALFAVHPINVESVAWVAERKNTLSLLFFLSSLYTYLRFARVIASPEKRSIESADKQAPLFVLPDDPQRLYALAATLFLCALFSKSTSSSMPVVALLLIIWKRKRFQWSDLWPVLPLLVVGFAMGMLTAYMEHVRVGISARPQAWIYSPTELGQIAAKLLIAGKVFWFYLGKLIWPIPLLFNYPRWPVDAGDVSQYAFVAAAVALIVILLLLRRRIGGGPALAALVYVITLFPALGFVDVWPMQYGFVADHFVYLPAIAVFALVAAIVTRYVPFESLAGGAAVILALCAGVSFSHAQDFKDSPTLWAKTLTNSKYTSWVAANNYGVYLRQTGRPSEAEQWFKHVLKLKPDHPEARWNLAVIAMQRAEYDDKLRKQATTRPTTELAALIPTTTPAEYNEQAIRWLEGSIAAQPNYVDAHYSLAQLLASLDRNDEADVEYKKVLEINPKHFGANMVLGNKALKSGDSKGATDYFISAVESDPDEPAPHAKLGVALLQQGRVDDGFAQWGEVLKLAPDDPTWSNQFGQSMLESREWKKATGYLQQALRIDPTYVPALTNFGIAAARQGYPEKAKPLFLRALELQPNYQPAKENLEALESGRLQPATTPSNKPTSMPS